MEFKPRPIEYPELPGTQEELTKRFKKGIQWTFLTEREDPSYPKHHYTLDSIEATLRKKYGLSEVNIDKLKTEAIGEIALKTFDRAQFGKGGEVSI